MHHGLAHVAAIAAEYLPTHDISEASPPSEGARDSLVGTAKDTQTTDIYAWASDLSIMDRFLRDDQRHERLAVSLGLSHSVPSVFSQGSKDSKAHPNMPTKAKDPAQPDLPWEDSSYRESSYDPYDQPPPSTGLPSPSALPAPDVSLEQYQELMREYFASEEPNSPPPGKTAEPPPPKTEKAVLPVETVPTLPAQRKSMSVQALLNNSDSPDHLSPGYPPEPRHVPPSKIVSISALQLEPDACLEKDDDCSIRAFAKEAHKRLVPPISSSTAPTEPTQAIPVRSDEGGATPDRQMLSQHRSRLEESRGHPRQRTVRRALLRKRKREEDHPPGRAQPATRPGEE